jgi:hypothetical protein
VAQSTSLLPELNGAYLPPASPATGLKDGEAEFITALTAKLMALTWPMYLTQAYYDGEQRLANLGVSIPPSLASVRTVVDWPRICVDPLVQRAVIDGFRLPGQTDSDSELWEHWQANNMDAEFPLCVLDALTLGRGYMIVGSPDTPGESPIVTVESPFNLVMNWDPRTRKVTAAYQAYQAEGVSRGVLYLPDVTVSMSRDQYDTQWVIDDRDQHNFGEVPVVRFANRQRSANREGRSEITPAIRNTTDSAVRTLLGMEIAREFYSIPHRYGLGLSEDDFRNPDGTPKTAIEMVMSNFIAFERDASGNVPQVGQFQAFDPSVFTKILDAHAKIMSSNTGYPPDYFGLVSTANPASADAIRSAQDPMNRRGRQVQNELSGPVKQVQQLIWRFAHDGQPVPQDLRRLEPDWQSVETPTPSATADAMLKQKQAGYVTQDSRVALKRLGYSSAEIDQLIADQARNATNEEVADIATDLEATQLRTAKAITADLTEAATPPTP